MPKRANYFDVILLTSSVLAVAAQVLREQSIANVLGNLTYMTAKECWQVSCTVQFDGVAYIL